MFRKKLRRSNEYWQLESVYAEYRYYIGMQISCHNGCANQLIFALKQDNLSEGALFRKKIPLDEFSWLSTKIS